MDSLVLVGKEGVELNLEISTSEFAVRSFANVMLGLAGVSRASLETVNTRTGTRKWQSIK